MPDSFPQTPVPQKPSPRAVLSGIAVFVVVLFVLFHRSLFPSQILFSNDGPLGANNVAALKMPQGFFGIWQDLSFLGTFGGSYSANLTGLMIWLLGPLYLAKFYVPIVLLFAGLCGWFFFRQLKLGPPACFLGGLAVILNSDFLSTACWGVGPQVIAIGFSFLALAALVNDAPGKSWARIVLAGFAVGMSVMEGADIGAIFSLFVAAFALVHSWVASEGSGAGRLARGIGRLAVVAACAVFIAAQVLSSLIGANITGIVGTQQDAQTKAAHWDWATQWSLPKRETLALIIPGIFGYRMTPPPADGGNYWGAVGRDPAWDNYDASDKQGPPPDPGANILRFTGGGNYGGILVELVALWAVGQSFRRNNPVFARIERRFIWFWAGCMGISLLLAFGRYAPFYRIVYALPFFSTIRNPTKFLHVFSFALVILFAYGVHGLARRYLGATLLKTSGMGARLATWWGKANAFDKRWTLGCSIAVGVSLLGWLIYASSRQSLVRYLESVPVAGENSEDIIVFSIQQVGWFVLFLAASVVLMLLILSGSLGGRRARWGGILIGLFLVVDLGRADLPWIVYWNYVEKYETYPSGPNPIVQFLCKKPYEHRVAILPPWIAQMVQAPKDILEQLSRAQGNISGLYEIEWKQHLFLYYNIQSLDIIQRSRLPEDVAAYEGALVVRSMETLPNVTRRWELTNTRYLIGIADFLNILNNQFDPGRARFRIAERFNIVAKPGVANSSRYEDVTAEPATNGTYAVFEFTGALPRAGLYRRWQISTNDQDTLKQLASPSFDPAQTVLVASTGSVPANAADSPDHSGAVEFTSYAPTRIQLTARAGAPSVLLLNDRYDANWEVRVDGRPAELLRCNHIMRGVYVPSGTHTIEFAFRLPTRPLRVSLAAISIGLLLLGYVFLPRRSKNPVGPATNNGDRVAQKPLPPGGTGRALA